MCSWMERFTEDPLGCLKSKSLHWWMCPTEQASWSSGKEMLLCPGMGKSNHPCHLRWHYTMRPPGSAKQSKEINIIFFFGVFCGIGNSNISPAWSPRSSGPAAPGLTVGYSVVVWQHIFKTWMIRFSFPPAQLNKVMSEWVWSLAGFAVFLCCYLQGCYIIVS